METGKIEAITYNLYKLSNVIITPIEVANYFDKAKAVKMFGIWDTGATTSCITKKYAEQLGLTAVSTSIMRGVFGERESPVYRIVITFKNKNIVLERLVVGCDTLASDEENIGLLIGMDVIGLGDFTVSNHNNQTVMSFRIPSLATTDYVQMLQTHTPIKNSNNINRNDSCPCGSGKKYKNCCGKK